MVNRAERVLTDDELWDRRYLPRMARVYVGCGERLLTRMFRVLQSVMLAEIRAAEYVLTPGRYVGAPAGEDDGEAVGDKVARLTKELLAALDESARLDRRFANRWSGCRERCVGDRALWGDC